MSTVRERLLLLLALFALLLLGWCVTSARAADDDATIQFVNATIGPALFYIDDVSQGMLLSGMSKTVSVKPGKHHLVAVVSVDPVVTVERNVRLRLGATCTWKISE